MPSRFLDHLMCIVDKQTLLSLSQNIHDTVRISSTILQPNKQTKKCTINKNMFKFNKEKRSIQLEQCHTFHHRIGAQIIGTSSLVRGRQKERERERESQINHPKYSVRVTHSTESFRRMEHGTGKSAVERTFTQHKKEQSPPDDDGSVHLHRDNTQHMHLANTAQKIRTESVCALSPSLSHTHFCTGTTTAQANRPRREH